MSNAAVLLLNMPVWCFRANGRRGAGVHHHNVCRRIVYDRARSRAHVAAAASPDQQDAAFRRVAEHYSQVASSVSVFDALQPLIAGGALDLVDFTSDGKHPHVFPLATRRGEVVVPPSEWKKIESESLANDSESVPQQHGKP